MTELMIPLSIDDKVMFISSHCDAKISKINSSKYELYMFINEKHIVVNYSTFEEAYEQYNEYVHGDDV